MKSLIAILLVGFPGMLLAQSRQFNTLETSIHTLIEKEQWDEVLILSPDLVIEEPFRGDGYYYTALAFLKMEEPEKAESWLDKAESMADDKLKAKINSLKQEIEKSRQIQALESSALNREQGDPVRAASEWNELWEMDKSAVGYALNAVELYVENGEYEAAMRILEDPLMKSDPSSANLRTALGNTPEMKEVYRYEEAMQQAFASFEQGDYTASRDLFADALRLKPDDEDALIGKSRAEDEQAWQKAREINTIDSFESYLQGPTAKAYSDNARQILRNSMLKYGKEYAENGELDRMELYLNKLKSDYALNSSDITQADEIMVGTYESAAERAGREKYYSSLSNAINYYQKADALNPRFSYSSKIQRLERKRRRYGRSDMTYLAFVYDSVTNVGLSLGGLKNRKVGAYFTARLNPAILASPADYSLNADGSFDGTLRYNDIRYENRTRTGDLDVMLGITKKLAYPLWIYLGGGMTYSQKWQEMSMYTDTGELHKTEWVLMNDEEKILPMAEAGLIVNFARIHLRGGVKTSDFENFENLALSVGIGFSFY